MRLIVVHEVFKRVENKDMNFSPFFGVFVVLFTLWNCVIAPSPRLNFF